VNVGRTLIEFVNSVELISGQFVEAQSLLLLFGSAYGIWVMLSNYFAMRKIFNLNYEVSKKTKWIVRYYLLCKSTRIR